MKIFILLLTVTVFFQIGCSYAVERIDLHSKDDKLYLSKIVTTGAKTDAKQVIDLGEHGISKAVRLYYNPSTQYAYVVAYSDDYNVYVFDIKKKSLKKSIMIKSIEDQIAIIVNPRTYNTYITYFDKLENDMCTIIFDRDFNVVLKTKEFRVDPEDYYPSYFTDDGEYLYTSTFSSKDKKWYFIKVNTKDNNLLKKIDLIEMDDKDIDVRKEKMRKALE